MRGPYGKNSNFKGKKGRSGRYSAKDEGLKKRVIHKAWERKDQEMSDTDATQIVLKDMTVKTDILSGGQQIGGVDIFSYLEWIETHANQENNSNRENKPNDKEVEDMSGGDGGIKNVQHYPVSDTISEP